MINAAAYTQVDRAEQEQALAFELNRDGVANLAAACKKYAVPLLHISTDYVFDGSKQGAYVEDDRMGVFPCVGGGVQVDAVEAVILRRERLPKGMAVQQFAGQAGGLLLLHVHAADGAASQQEQCDGEKDKFV